MDKLVEMIEKFAEQAAVPAKVAVEKIILAHGYECWGSLIVIGFFILLSLSLLGGSALVNFNTEDKPTRELMGIIFVGSGFVLILTLLIAALSTGTYLACVLEPAGSLMKTFLVK